jgi:hypothetical protein
LRGLLLLLLLEEPVPTITTQSCTAGVLVLKMPAAAAAGSLLWLVWTLEHYKGTHVCCVNAVAAAAAGATAVSCCCSMSLLPAPGTAFSVEVHHAGAAGAAAAVVDATTTAAASHHALGCGILHALQWAAAAAAAVASTGTIPMLPLLCLTMPFAATSFSARSALLLLLLLTTAAAATIAAAAAVSHHALCCHVLQGLQSTAGLGILDKHHTFGGNEVSLAVLKIRVAGQLLLQSLGGAGVSGFRGLQGRAEGGCRGSAAEDKNPVFGCADDSASRSTRCYVQNACAVLLLLC